MGESAPNALQNVLFALAEDLLRKAGEVHFVARGGSMLPAILPGDDLVVQHVHPSDIQVGDAVLFRKQGRWFAHRVSEIERTSCRLSFLTRGDALRSPDAPVTAEELLGRVAGVLRSGVVTPLPSPNSLTQTILRAGIRHAHRKPPRSTKQ